MSTFQFPQKLHILLDQCKEKGEASIAWRTDGYSFQVVQRERFAEIVMPVHFRSNNYKTVSPQDCWIIHRRHYCCILTICRHTTFSFSVIWNYGGSESSRKKMDCPSISTKTFMRENRIVVKKWLESDFLYLIFRSEFTVKSRLLIQSKLRHSFRWRLLQEVLPHPAISRSPVFASLPGPCEIRISSKITFVQILHHLIPNLSSKNGINQRSSPQGRINHHSLPRGHVSNQW